MSPPCVGQSPTYVPPKRRHRISVSTNSPFFRILGILVIRGAWGWLGGVVGTIGVLVGFGDIEQEVYLIAVLIQLSLFCEDSH